MQDGGRTWISVQEQLKDIALQYYSSLFSSEVSNAEGYIRGRFPRLSEAKWQLLHGECTDDEVSLSLKSTSPFKVSGPMAIRHVSFKTHGKLRDQLLFLW